MGNSPLATYTRISPNKTSPRNHIIDTITIHCVVGQCTAKTVVDLPHFVTYDPNNGASCNYAVGCDGSIAVCVDEKDRSWCTSNRDNDNRAITIEVASGTKHPYEVTDAAYNALIDLLVDICKRNPSIGTLKWKGDKSLIGYPEKQNMTVHRWFANKECPGEYLYSRHAKIAAEVNARIGNGSSNESSTKNNSTTSNLKSSIKAGDLVSIVDGAKYYNGTYIPRWVLNNKWYVKTDPSGDRVVVDKSEDGRYSINSPVNAKYLKIVKPKSDLPYLVRVSVDNLNIRKGPGTNYDSVGNTGVGLFTIVEIQNGTGSESGWGLLKSYQKNRNGWISLDYCKKV